MPDGGNGVAGETGQPGETGQGWGFHVLRRSSSGRGFSGRGFLGRPALIAVAAAVPMAEAVAANASAPAARVLSPEVTALAPLAVFHDLRWLFGLGGTWPWFVLALAAVVTVRSVLDAVLVWLAWPRELARPRATLLLGSSAALTVCAVLLLSPLVALTFGVALLPFSWPFLGVLPVLVLYGLLLSHGGAASWWWRTLPPLRAAAWLLAEFLVLSAAALLINRLPAGWVIPLAGLTGVINARAWYGVTTSLTSPLTTALSIAPADPADPAAPAAPPIGPPPVRVRHPRPGATRRLPVAPVAAVLAIALVIGVARAGFAVASAPHHHSGSKAAAASGTGASAVIGAGAPATRPAPGGKSSATSAQGQSPVLEIRGFGSSCCSTASSLRAIAGGALAQQFSYRGLNSGGQPLRQGAAASDLPLSLLGDRIAAQVERLHAETGRPVNLVAESEGTLGVYAMLARHPDVPVGSVVLLSPIVSPGQVSYPSDDRDARGAVPGYALQAVVWLVGGLSPFGSSGAEELINSVNEVGAEYARAAVQEDRLHPKRWLAVVPL
ncbi:MAG TPA: hypothetical protein VG268_20400, partial [Streptosporangiaceae bacterium]|nr:hypothetical protein [Streptosporangiaceae bacterium]